MEKEEIKRKIKDLKKKLAKHKKKLQLQNRGKGKFDNDYSTSSKPENQSNKREEQELNEHCYINLQNTGLGKNQSLDSDKNSFKNQISAEHTEKVIKVDESLLNDTSKTSTKRKENYANTQNENLTYETGTQDDDCITLKIITDEKLKEENNYVFDTSKEKIKPAKKRRTISPIKTVEEFDVTFQTVNDDLSERGLAFIHPLEHISAFSTNSVRKNCDGETQHLEINSQLKKDTDTLVISEASVVETSKRSESKQKSPENNPKSTLHRLKSPGNKLLDFSFLEDNNHDLYSQVKKRKRKSINSAHYTTAPHISQVLYSQDSFYVKNESIDTLEGSEDALVLKPRESIQLMMPKCAMGLSQDTFNSLSQSLLRCSAKCDTTEILHEQGTKQTSSPVSKMPDKLEITTSPLAPSTLESSENSQCCATLSSEASTVEEEDGNRNPNYKKLLKNPKQRGVLRKKKLSEKRLSAIDKKSVVEDFSFPLVPDVAFTQEDFELPLKDYGTLVQTRLSQDADSEYSQLSQSLLKPKKSFPKVQRSINTRKNRSLRSGAVSSPNTFRMDAKSFFSCEMSNLPAKASLQEKDNNYEESIKLDCTEDSKLYNESEIDDNLNQKNTVVADCKTHESILLEEKLNIDQCDLSDNRNMGNSIGKKHIKENKNLDSDVKIEEIVIDGSQVHSIMVVKASSIVQKGVSESGNVDNAELLDTKHIAIGEDCNAISYQNIDYNKNSLKNSDDAHQNNLNINEKNNSEQIILKNIDIFEQVKPSNDVSVECGNKIITAEGDSDIELSKVVGLNDSEMLYPEKNEDLSYLESKYSETLDIDHSNMAKVDYENNGSEMLFTEKADDLSNLESNDLEGGNTENLNTKLITTNIKETVVKSMEVVTKEEIQVLPSVSNIHQENNKWAHRPYSQCLSSQDDDFVFNASNNCDDVNFITNENKEIARFQQSKESHSGNIVDPASHNCTDIFQKFHEIETVEVVSDVSVVSSMNPDSQQIVVALKQKFYLYDLVGNGSNCMFKTSIKKGLEIRKVSATMSDREGITYIALYVNKFSSYHIYVYTLDESHHLLDMSVTEELESQKCIIPGKGNSFISLDEEGYKLQHVVSSVIENLLALYDVNCQDKLTLNSYEKPDESLHFIKVLPEIEDCLIGMSMNSAFFWNCENGNLLRQIKLCTPCTYCLDVCLEGGLLFTVTQDLAENWKIFAVNPATSLSCEIKTFHHSNDFHSSNHSKLNAHGIVGKFLLTASSNQSFHYIDMTNNRGSNQENNIAISHTEESDAFTLKVLTAKERFLTVCKNQIIFYKTVEIDEET